MINRICISINNRCNLACRYCHFQEKKPIESVDMDVFKILDNVKAYASSDFKIGFVGNGEAFLDWPLLKSYIQYISDTELISAYTITNGTVTLPDEEIQFLEEHKINVGFSVDGYRELHNLNRCNSFDRAMINIEKYKYITGHYPTFNATVSAESLANADKVISFFAQFGTRITFSRLIGKHGISLDSYREFLDRAEKSISIRRGAIDCTMYGGQCGAGINNFFFANGNIYYCGNCIDFSPLCPSGTSFFNLGKISLDFNRQYCYKESV